MWVETAPFLPAANPPAPKTSSPVIRGLRDEGVDATFTPQMGWLHSAFLVGPVIGRGGYSEVRAARCKRTGREMALKVRLQRLTPLWERKALLVFKKNI